MDKGYQESDELLAKLERQIHKEYSKAAKEMDKKSKDYLSKFKQKDADKRQQVKDGKLSQKEYRQWRVNAMMTGDRWIEMRDTLAQDLHNTNKIARSIANGYMPEAYAINHNYGTYEIESGYGISTSYTLYDRQTVERLIREQPEVLPAMGDSMKRKIQEGKAIKWRRGQVQSVVLQSVLQGESIPNMAKRISTTLHVKDEKAAIRYARTAMTGAEAAGRVDSYKRAQELGIELEQEWEATLDPRTRASHVDLDGERVPVDGVFSNGCRFPGDPQGAPAEVYNCRCRLVAALKGYDYKSDGRWSNLPEGMTYEEWKETYGSHTASSYYKPINESGFVNEFFSSGDARRINERFKMLDNEYHARIDSITTALQTEQRQYDLLRKNYIEHLKQENPQMRQSTLEKRADELLGLRPTKDTINLFEGGNFNMSERVMSINNLSPAPEGGIAVDVERYQKRLDRWISRHGTAEGYTRGNVGITHEATFIHEYGHAIDATYGVAKDERFLSFYQQFTRDDVMRGVSEYAATNEQEFIAECFLDSFMGEAQGDISKQFMNILKEIVK